MAGRALGVLLFVLFAAPASAQPSERQRPDALRHYRDGEQLMSAERFAEAVDAFQRAIHADRLFARAYYRQGQAYMALRRFASAVSAFRDSREAFASLHGVVPPAEVSLALGSAHFRNGQLEDAEREWTAAVAVSPRLGEAHNNLAALYAMNGRKTEAEHAVRAAERAGFRVHPQLKDDIRAIADRASVTSPEYRSAPAAAAR